MRNARGRCHHHMDGAKKDKEEGEEENSKHSKNYRENHRCRQKVAVFVALPYFLEEKASESMPWLHITDFEIGYTNHRRFRNPAEKGSKLRYRGSAARLFTNTNLTELPMPDNKEGGGGRGGGGGGGARYKHCKLCRRFVLSSNRHCMECGFCSSKDGRTYHHCYECGICVKPDRSHCKRCGKCTTFAHVCIRNNSRIKWGMKKLSYLCTKSSTVISSRYCLLHRYLTSLCLTEANTCIA